MIAEADPQGEAGLRHGRASGLALAARLPYHGVFVTTPLDKVNRPMSIDKSLRRKNSLQRARSVLTRAERILILQADDRFPEGRSPFNLPKVRVVKVAKKVKKAAKDEEAPAEEAKKGGKK